MTTLIEIPEWDHRDGGLPQFVRTRSQAAVDVMDAVLGGLGIADSALRPQLSLGDRIAARRLAAMNDPYRAEILALPQIMGRPGAVAFSLSYEFACTARVFETGGVPRLLRVLDWPFHGLGARIEVVRLSGPAGDWVTATWPGVMGVLHGAAPGRFAVALNQAPEPQTGFGRVADWLSAKRRFLRQTAIPAQHLLRQVFETAPDYGTAKQLLTETPVAVPVIFTLSGTKPGEACVIERTETGAANPTDGPPVAANHFTTTLGANGHWRQRGIDSTGRHRAACALTTAPSVERLEAPILNSLTRLALTLDATGHLSVAGYEGETQVTQAREVAA